MVFLSGVALLILSGCAATRNIYFDARAPAMLNIPRHIQSLAIIDRSVPENKDLNLLEGIITGEGVKQDKLATRIVIDGLAQSLQNSTRYDVIRTAEQMKGSGAGGRFPVPLSWEEIERDYFTRPRKNPYLAEGARMMEVNDWDRAISALKKALETGDIKTMGRAAHNLAVVYEILGANSGAGDTGTTDTY